MLHLHAHKTKMDIVAQQGKGLNKIDKYNTASAQTI